jgi:cyclomaltodextrinase / maltogenic alpha-amylase / neopullulanase
MRRRLTISSAMAAITLLSIFCPPNAVPGVAVLTKDAVVWGQNQVVRACITGPMDRGGLLLFNGSESPFQLGAGTDTFTVAVKLGEGTSRFLLRVDSAGIALFTDTLRLTLGYNLRPTVFAYATGSAGPVVLHATILENPDSSGVSFSWTPDGGNPAPTTLGSPFDSVTSVSIPPVPSFGEYIFTVKVATNRGDTVRARACVIVDSGATRPFDIRTDHARWIDSAVIYGITPSIFVFEGQFAHITAKIPELVQLGVNTIWLQPVYSTYRKGQGYDVTDYFAVRPDLGSESDLRALIAGAHDNGIRVLFDFVPNHTSIFHPYAQHSVTYGANSHYYSFYQRTFDAAPYSQHYKNYQGFVNYFWDELPNLDYGNPEVRRMIIEAGKYWIEKFGIDGYRVDVAWGPGARDPEFFREWRLALKRIRPDAFLLAEDKATWPSVFNERFDAAYDWAPEQSWVSHWVWQTSYSTTGNPTIFNNNNQAQRSALLRAAMTNSGTGYAANAKIVHFMENNDTFRFLATHDLARTKMAAAMMFSIPGLPLLFNGQEIGASTHPYSAPSIFSANRSIRAQDSYGLFSFYRQMAIMRKRFPALISNNYAEMPVTPGAAVFAYRRWEGRQNVFAIVNMGNADATVAVTLPVASLGLDSLRTYYLSDQVSGQVLSVSTAELSPLSVSVPGYTTRVYLLDTVAVTSVDQGSPVPVPETFALLQNYPNPFNPSTVIEFEIPRRSEIKLMVYDVVGREVEQLINRTIDAGRHTVQFRAGRLASGIYFYRLQADGLTFTRKMMVLK